MISTSYLLFLIVYYIYELEAARAPRVHPRHCPFTWRIRGEDVFNSPKEDYIKPEKAIKSLNVFQFLAGVERKIMGY